MWPGLFSTVSPFVGPVMPGTNPNPGPLPVNSSLRFDNVQMGDAPVRTPEMAGMFGQVRGRMPPGMQMPNTAGLFDRYMQRNMLQQHRMPDIPGVYGNTPGGYRGFLAPQMPLIQMPQPQLPPWIAGLLGNSGNQFGGGVGAGDTGGVGDGTGGTASGDGVGTGGVGGDGVGSGASSGGSDGGW